MFFIGQAEGMGDYIQVDAFIQLILGGLLDILDGVQGAIPFVPGTVFDFNISRTWFGACGHDNLL
jgi:hypothetical protein